MTYKVNTKKALSIEDVLHQVANLIRIEGYAPRGVVEPMGSWTGEIQNCVLFSGTLSIPFRRAGWGLEATIEVGFKRRAIPEEPAREEFIPQISVRWGSTTYLAPHAVAAAKLHTEVAEFACLIDAAISNMTTHILWMTVTERMKEWSSRQHKEEQETMPIRLTPNL